MKRYIHLIGVLFLLLGWQGGSLNAQTVTNSGDDGSPGTLRDLIENNTYSEITIPQNMVVTLEKEIVIDRELSIKGLTGAGIQVEDPGNSNYRLFNAQNGDFTLENLTLTGGFFNVFMEYGAIVYMGTDAGTLTMKDIIVPQSHARLGGVAYTELGTSLILENVNIQQTSAGNGGAIYSLSEEVTITNSSFGHATDASKGNVTTDNSSCGGAIYIGEVANPVITIENSYFGNNVAAFKGGAIAISNTTGIGDLITLNIIGCIFEKNRTENTFIMSNGGAISIDAENGPGVAVKMNISGESLFDGNSSYSGGAVSIKTAKNDITFTVSNENGGKPIFKNNETVYTGGAGTAYGSGGAIQLLCVNNNAGVINTHITADFETNHSSDLGGAVYVEAMEIHGDIHDGSSFTGNDSKNHGGAVYFMALRMVVKIGENSKGVNFINNTSLSAGGAVYVAGELIVNGAHFEENNAESGGAIYATAMYTPTNGFNNNLTVNNATFHKNHAIDDQYDPNFTGGGAIWMGQGSDFTINNVSFTENTSAQNGGAILVSSNSSLFLTGTDNKFEKNTAAELGGAIHLDIVRATLENGVFNLNQAKNGGAINTMLYESNTSFDVKEGVEFIANEASENGGAINLVAMDDTPYTIRGKETQNVLFKNNKATANGGSIHISGYYGIGTISHTTFESDLATYNAASGGAIYMAGTLSLEENTLKGLRASSKGGAINNEEGILTLTGCEFENNFSNVNGGAIFVNKGYSVRGILNLSKSIFAKNSATSEGGAIYISKGSLDLTESVSFTKNSADKGGAIYGDQMLKFSINGGLTEETMAKFTDNKSTDNGGSILLWLGNSGSISNAIFTSTSTSLTDYNAADGGAIYSVIPMTIHNIKVDNVKTQYNGGAVYNYYYEMAITNSSFTNNRAADSGGAICNNGPLNMTNVYALNNYANQYGGGIHNCENQNISLVNCLLAENKAEVNWGGGINNQTGGTVTLINCTIANNEAVYGGGLMNSASSATAHNTIVWGNKAATDANEHNIWGGNFFYSLIEGKDFGNNNNLNGTLGTNSDPRFAYVGDPTLTGPFRYGLLLGSPAINKGDNNIFPFGRTKYDLAGHDRIYEESSGGKIDLGVYEYPTLGPTAEFIEDNSVCEGSSGSLKIRLTGNAPWHVTYQIVGSNPLIERKQTIDAVDADGFSVLTGLTLSGGTTEYELVGVAQGKPGEEINGIVINKTTAKINSVSNPTVSAISGSSEVYVGGSIQLSNATSGGTWMISNSGVASITLGGKLTGIAAGTVEVWYVVTGSAPTNCETIVTHTVTVKTKGTDPDPEDPDPEDPDPEDPDPDPDPEWPPVVPEPDPDPDPDPDAWIIIRPGTEACFTDEFFNISFRLQYTAQSLRYAVAFTENSKTAGFEDVKTNKDLPQDGIVSIAIPKGVKPGTYSGYLLLIEKGSTDYKMYPFTIKIKDGVVITEQPQPITQQNNGERFTLSVKAQGDNLTYQWFYNGQRIEGATSATYETIYSADKEGLYYVEVYGDCGWIQSDEVMVTGCFGILIKWDDVLYVQNTDGRYVGFQWFRNGEAITTYGTSIYYTNPEGMQGTYHVRAYKADGTYDQSCAVEYTTVTRASSVTVYPTVVERNHYVTVESDELGGSYIGGVVEIYNLSGGKVYSQRLLTPQVQVPVNQPTGVYILQVTAPDGRKKTEKIVVR